ncbi:MAG: ABC transporter permease [Phycisphaeraceae bacterium]
MINYLIRRILLIIPTLLGMTMLVFSIMAFAPGDVADMLITSEGEMQAGDREARLQYIRERYGLDDPAPVQYLRWLNNISPVGSWTEANAADAPAGVGIPIGSNEEGHPRYLGFKTPDLGRSFIRNTTVWDAISAALPITILLNLMSVPITYIIAVGMGVYAGRYRGQSFDVLSGITMLAMWSVPVIWAGVLLQGFFANQQYLHWFPSSGLHDLQADSMPFLPRFGGEEGFQRGWLLDLLWHLALPVFCLSYTNFAFLSKLTRGSILENLRSDFVRTARAKGVGEKTVLWQHVFRNSLLPLITVAAFVVPSMLAGSVIVETIFSIPGMGRLMIQAIQFKDQEVVMSVTLVAGMLTLAAYLLADLLYAVADPRVSYE